MKNKPNNTDKIHTFDGDIKKFFTPFMLQVLNIEGIEDLAGVDRGTINSILRDSIYVKNEDYKAIETVLKMIKQ